MRLTKKELNIFNKNIRFLIKSSGYKMYEIARKLGVDVRELERWNRNDALPSFKNGVNLARLFNKRVEDLFRKKFYGK